MTAMKEKITTEGVVNLAYGNRILLNDTIEMLKKHLQGSEIVLDLAEKIAKDNE